MRNDPKKFALKFLEKYYLTDPSDVKLTAILGSEGILYKEVDSKGYQGNLIREGSKGIINVDSKITNIHKKRFVVAHEIGHWLLHNNEDLFSCTQDDLNIWNASTNRIENEANNFASHFLMPDEIFKDIFSDELPSMDTFRNISSRFNVSITSGAIKYKRLTNTPVFLLYCSKGKIKWTSSSLNFKFKSFGNIKNLPVPSESLTNRYFKNTSQRTNENVCLTKTWFPNDRSVKQDNYLNEFVFPMPQLEACITCLWAYDENI